MFCVLLLFHFSTLTFCAHIHLFLLLRQMNLGFAESHMIPSEKHFSDTAAEALKYCIVYILSRFFLLSTSTPIPQWCIKTVVQFLINVEVMNSRKINPDCLV